MSRITESQNTTDTTTDEDEKETKGPRHIVRAVALRKKADVIVRRDIPLVERYAENDTDGGPARVLLAKLKAIASDLEVCAVMLEEMPEDLLTTKRARSKNTASFEIGDTVNVKAALRATYSAVFANAASLTVITVRDSMIGVKDAEGVMAFVPRKDLEAASLDS